MFQSDIKCSHISVFGPYGILTTKNEQCGINAICQQTPL